MPRVAWTLYDPQLDDTLEFEWNPNQFSPAGRSSSITSEGAVAPNGQRIYFQGIDGMKRNELDGAVGSQAFFLELDAWKDKHYPLVLTDDTGTSWTILWDTWTWKRVSRRNRWRYDYSASAIVL